MKTIWLVGAGAEAVPVIQRAKEMGLRVIASDGDPEAPGFKFADEGVVVSTYDHIGTFRKAQDYSFHGIMAACSDVPVTVAYVSNALWLPGITPTQAAVCANKHIQKLSLKEAGIPVPHFKCIRNEQAFRDYLETLLYASTCNLVIKPVDSRGSRGVQRLDLCKDYLAAYREAKAYSPTGAVLIEEWLDGPQISTETVVVDGKCLTPGFVDRNYRKVYWPRLIEDGGQQPTALSEKEKRAVTECVEEAILALGIRNGTAKGDMVLTKDGPKVIEIAARLSGGYLATHQIPMATGVDIVGIAIRLALGEPVDIEEARPKFQRAVAIRYDLTMNERNHTERGRHVIAEGATREEAIRNAEREING